MGRESLWKEQQQTQAPGRRDEVSPAFVSVYANEVTIAMTLWDICLRFGELRGTEGQVLTVRRVADVTLAVPLAKRLVEILTKTIQQYELDIGPVALPLSGPVG